MEKCKVEIRQYEVSNFIFIALYNDDTRDATQGGTNRTALMTGILSGVHLLTGNVS